MDEVVVLMAEIPTLADGETRQRIQVFPPASDKTYAHPKQKFKLTKERLEGFVADINTRGDAIPVDQDHAFAKGMNAPAAGWFVKGSAELTDGGLFADVEWTADGAADVRARRYRFISPEFSFSSRQNDGKVEKVPCLAAASMTNRPFFTEMEPIAAEDETEIGAEGVDDNEGGNGMNLTAELAETLGIAADASEDEVAEAIANLSAANVDLTQKLEKAPTAEAMQTLLADAQKGVEASKKLDLMERDAAIDKAVERNAIVEAQRSHYESFWALDAEGTAKLIAEMPDGTLFKVAGDTKAVVVDAEGKPVGEDGKTVTADLAPVTIQGSEYDVDEQSAKIAATATENLRRAGKTHPTEEEFLSASEDAKTQLGIS